MTNEQAIDRYTNNAKFEWGIDGNVYKITKAKDGKEICQQVCRDAISRQAVLDGLKGCMCEDWVKTLFATMVKQLPSVTQKSGKWIMSDDGLYRPICDKCGAHPWKGYIPTVEEVTEVFKYCPNCGAKMESEVSNG